MHQCSDGFNLRPISEWSSSFTYLYWSLNIILERHLSIRIIIIQFIKLYYYFMIVLVRLRSPFSQIM